MNKHKKTAIAMIVTAAGILFTACSSTKYYTADDIVDVSVSGADGNGTANVMIDRNAIMDKINNDVYKGDGDEVELAKAELMLYEYVKISADNTEKLSNGDKVVVALSYDNDALKEYGFGVDEKNSIYSYTVEGLKEPTKLDAFADLTVTFEGIEPYGIMKFEYTGNDEYIKDYVSFTTDADQYTVCNGEEIIIKAKIIDISDEKDNYVLKETEKTYTATGITYRAAAEDMQNADLSQLDADMLEAAKDVMNRSTYEKDSMIYGFKIFPEGNTSKEWKVVGDYSIKEAKKMFLYNKEKHTNDYSIYWEVTIPLEKVKIDEWAVKTDGFSQGDKYDLKLYVRTTADDINVINNELDISDLKISSMGYGYSTAGNFLSYSLDEIIESYQENSAFEWEITEIKN